MNPDEQAALQRLQYAGQGLNENVLQAIERDFQLSIPPTYRVLLRLVGNNPNAIPEWIGTDWTGADLYDIQREAHDLVRENPCLRNLPDDAFVLLFHQGYSLLFVPAELGDASPVFVYAETDEPCAQEFRRVAERLDEMMMHRVPELWVAAKLVTS
ncbi:SMI1/KNR4 family protein [Deinococcus phoenicis]|uniref:SMI1/KNR4 family protein n=1 Tax=Deinococcus phoenicis TaxID=1476583 RepID=UPI001268981C|nr:SMI1/KNR4 family protein [Deinococcus phoenicis]